MEWQGSFEIPGSDHKVGGRLVIDEGESLLRLYGSFYPREMPDIPDQIPLVWGVTEEGQAITLVDLAALGTAMRLAPGLWRTESWICGHAIEGHIEPQDPLTFSAVTCEMTYLSSWLPSLKPSAEHRVDGFLVDARPNSMGRVEHDGVFYEFHSAAGIQHGFDESTIRYPTFLTATPAEERELEDLVNMFVTPIEALLWLATDRFSELTTSVHLDDERGSTKARVWSSTLKPRNFQSLARRLARSEVLFTAEEMPGGTEEGVIRWLDHWKRIRHSIGPVIARYRAPFSYTNDRLATSVSALESYSTTKRNWAELSDAEMARRTSVIRDALTEVEPALVQWAVDALEDASRETLRNRLKKLISDSGDLEPALFGSKKNQRQFIHEAVESRNRIAHLLPSGGLDDGGSLYWAHRGFIWLLRYHLMVDLGFAPEETARRIIENYQFRQEAKRLRSDLETR